VTDHHHYLQQRAAAAAKVAMVGALVNLVLSTVKIYVGFAANAQSLVADGIHSFSDLLSDALVWLAARHAAVAPDEKHPYGHGRFETVATLALGIILVLVAAGIAWDAAERLFYPGELLIPDHTALYAAAFSILANELLYHYTVHVGHKIHSSLLMANAWHHRSDAVSSIVVLVGVAGALAGLEYLDAVAAVLVGVMIAKIGWDLSWESLQVLADKGLDEERITVIRETIKKVGGVRDLHMLRTRSMGGHASADVHVMVEPRISVSEGHMISVLVEQALKQEIEEIEDVIVHIDPEDDEETPPTMGLPQRNQIETLLRERLQGLDIEVNVENLILHYLNGKIDIDLHVAADSPPAENREKTLASVRQRLSDQDWLGKIVLLIK